MLTDPEFPLTRLGYDVIQVHRFIKWAKERSAVTDTLPQEIVAEVKFSTARRAGYDVAAVDEWIESLPTAPIDPAVENALSPQLQHYSEMRISADGDAEQARRRRFVAFGILIGVLIFVVVFSLINQ